MKNYYDTLGVSKNANKDEIKQAYHKLAHKYHPDKGGDEKKFKEINEAYQVLGDEQKKAQYDQFGPSFGSQGFRGFHGFDFNNPSGFGGRDFSQEFDLGDIFSEFFGGARTATRARKATGQDIRIDITITLEEAYKGIVKNISLKKYSFCDRCRGEKNEPGSGFNACKTCGGSGEIRAQRQILFGNFIQVSECKDCRGAGKTPEKKCEKCRGAGSVQSIENIAINIPAGIHSGEAVGITGKGEYGEGGCGDLYAYIHINNHPLFTRDGEDIFSATELSFPQAALGADILVKTLIGSEYVKIPVGVQSGETIKLKGKGMKRLHGSGYGDHYVKITIRTPQKLSKRAKELLEELSRKM